MNEPEVRAVSDAELSRFSPLNTDDLPEFRDGIEGYAMHEGSPLFAESSIRQIVSALALHADDFMVADVVFDEQARTLNMRSTEYGDVEVYAAREYQTTDGGTVALWRLGDGGMRWVDLRVREHERAEHARKRAERDL